MELTLNYDIEFDIYIEGRMRDMGCTYADQYLHKLFGRTIKSKCQECPFAYCLDDIKDGYQRRNLFNRIMNKRELINA